MIFEHNKNLDMECHLIYIKCRMKAKKVTKTFTCDEGVYDWLVAKLKQAEIGIGVSNLLDGYLKYIYQDLKEVLNYIEKNNIGLPLSYVVHKVLDNHTVFYMVDWEAVEHLPKREEKEFKKLHDNEVRMYVEGLREDYEQRHKRKWLELSSMEISQVDRSDNTHRRKKK